MNRTDYCNFLISSHINFTNTYLADHVKGLSHDTVNRYLRKEEMTSNVIWEHVRGNLIPCEQGCVIFDDTLLDKNHSHKIELVRKQYSGNTHSIIKGIGVVNCIYLNPENGEFWLVDYRVFDKDHDGKTKLDHVKEMLLNLHQVKNISFSRVLMDGWYATKELMLLIDSMGKKFYCPIKSNRQVDDSAGQRPYRAVETLTWTFDESEHGKLIKIQGFPKDFKVRLFWVAVSSNRTDWVVTNDHAQKSAQETHEICALRWKIEQFHRELKQLTGIEKCQCRKAIIQRNHIGCAMLVWNRLTDLARQAKTTIYQLKSRLLSAYLRHELQFPTLAMAPINP